MRVVCLTLIGGEPVSRKNWMILDETKVTLKATHTASLQLRPHYVASRHNLLEVTL